MGFVKEIFTGSKAARAQSAAADTAIRFQQLGLEEQQRQFDVESGRFGVERERRDRLDLLEQERFDIQRQLQERLLGLEQERFGFARDAFERGQAGLAPFREAGTEALGGLEELFAGQTPEGLDERLGQIFGGEAFGRLREERGRAVSGQLAQTGLQRSGAALREAAAVPTGVGLGIEQLLFGRQREGLGSLAGLGAQAALGGAGIAAPAGIPSAGQLGAPGTIGLSGANLGGGGAAQSAAISQLLALQGQTGAGGITGAAGARAAGGQNLLDLVTALIPSGGGGGSSVGVTGGTAGTGATATGTASNVFFSDPALKMNVEKISEIRPLNLYQWDWIPEAKGTMIEKCSNIGFMADEVEEWYPHHVSNFAGFKVIDYKPLIEEMREAA